MKAKLRKKHLRLESLEGRAMMTGNVTADVVNGKLEIDGDAAANTIVITQIGSGEYTIAGDATTTVNGEPLGAAATVPA